MTPTPLPPLMEDDIVLRFLHTADWHLGRRFPRLRDEGRLALARSEVLDRVFGAAERHDVHAVLCAGDLFDEPNPLPECWQSLVTCLARRGSAKRPVVLLPGDHDPLLPDSIWARGQPFREALPPWVHVVDREDFVLTLPGGAVLYAVPCTSRAGQRDPTLSIPKRATDDARVRIGLVHGSTFDLEGCQTAFPIARDAAIERGLDYLAIGDTHGFRFVPADRAAPPTVYPGAPEPTDFDEREAGNVAVVAINRQRRATVQQERVAYWTWEEHDVRTLDQLRALEGRGDLANRVLRLRVDMALPAPDLDAADAILQRLGGTLANPPRVGVLDLDRERLRLDSDGLEALFAELPEVLRAAVRRLKAEEAKPERAAVARQALLHLYRATRASGAALASDATAAPTRDA